MHDASKVLMGTTESNDKVVECFDADPATFPAGTVVRNNAGALSKTTGQIVGVSLGRSMSDTKKTAVCLAGSKVPVLAADVRASAQIQEILYVSKLIGELGNDITIIYNDSKTDGSAEANVTGHAITVEIESGTTTAETVAAAIVADSAANALVSATVDDGEDDTAQEDFSPAVELSGGEDAGDFAVDGAAVYVSDVTGMAVDENDDNAVITRASYVGTAKIGTAEDGSEVGAVVINMTGGL